MRQTYPATECIIVNDGSTDNSISLCQRLIDDYSGPTQFVILHHDKNRGLSAARNTGTDAATGEYIFYVDSDDEITPDCLEKLVAPILSDDGIEVIMAGLTKDYSAMPGVKNRIKQWSWNQQTKQEKNLTSNDYIVFRNSKEISKWFYSSKSRRPFYVWNKLLKLSFVKDNLLYNKEGLLWEDNLWMLYLLRKLHHLVIVPEATYIQHFRSGSIQTVANNEVKLRHYGFFFKEMAEHTVYGERIEEVQYWLQDFCRFFVDASDNEDYQYAYNAFLRQLSDGKHEKEVQRLRNAHRMAKSHIGRWLYREAVRATNIVKRVIKG